MKNLSFGRIALRCCVAAAMLAGCGGAQPPVGAPGATSAKPTAQSRMHRASSSSGDLLYITTTNALVVVSYPDWKIVATVPGSYSYDALCSDPNSGNVFLTSGAFSQSQEILEYTHGGTTPIATLSVPSEYTNVWGCSVEPTTGNLAAGASGPGYKDGALLIYQSAQGSPNIYTDKHFRLIASPVYDSSGDAIVAATTKKIGFKIAELPAGKKTFKTIRLNENIFSPDLQWDGKYLAFENYGRPSTLYQIQIAGNTGTIVGTEQVDHAANATIWIHGDLLFGFDNQTKKPNNRPIAVWRYPTAGEPTSKFYGVAKGKHDGLISLTVSVAPSR